MKFIVKYWPTVVMVAGAALLIGGVAMASVPWAMILSGFALILTAALAIIGGEDN